MIGNNGINAEKQVYQLSELLEKIKAIRSEMLHSERAFRADYRPVHPAHKTSERNLLHYLALRQHDIRPLQEELASLGLSSLGRTESNVLASLNAVLAILYRISSSKPPEALPIGCKNGFSEGKALLASHTEALLGPKPSGRDVRIMVTMPSCAVDDYGFVKELLMQGMDCMRINCAYDDSDAWAGMIRNLRRAREETGKHCRVLMDLAGPKLRLGPISPGPQVIKWRPHRDDSGHVSSPAGVWLTAIENPEPPPRPADATLPVPAEWLSKLSPGNVIKFRDARGSLRSMIVAECIGMGRWAESHQKAYVASGSLLRVACSETLNRWAASNAAARVGEVISKPQSILLRRGDTLVLTRSLAPGKGTVSDERGIVLSPAKIGVTLPDIFLDVRVGESIWFDDGKIGGFIRSVNDEELEIEITHARDRGEKLFADKGINLPDSNLRLPALTEKDLKDLSFIARNADLVGYSFVRSDTDVFDLQHRLADLGATNLGVVLKIETRKAFERLPQLMLAAMRSPSCGVMIARGDLAVECGFERLAEVQEEILWIAEAAHMPVIWATQVLEKLAKQGIASRAEITDAAMGVRAECVMLNKGSYIVSAIRTLDNILRRMQEHQIKKRTMLRQLGLADRFSSRIWPHLHLSSVEASCLDSSCSLAAHP